MSKVTIVQRIVPHYRIPFFEALHRELARAGIELQLIYGQAYPGTVPRSEHLPHRWSVRIHNRYFNTPFGQCMWQSCGSRLEDSDLIVVEQANFLLLNYWLMMTRGRRTHQLAFWGHGRNFQAGTAQSWRERCKRSLLNKVDWWFAYTEASAQTVREAGFSPERITVVQNAIDNQELEAGLMNVTQSDLADLRSELGLTNDHVALYCGGMYAGKKLGFLLAACEAIRQRIVDFHVIFIGNGPEQATIEQAAQQYGWIHYVGPKVGKDRAVYFKASQALLMPGLVGLAIVDSFIARTPLFTTDSPSHSPEISYLEPGINGVMTPCSVSHYADAVAGFFESEELRTRLRQGCQRCADMYTLEHFVERFASGIVRCLSGTTTA